MPTSTELNDSVGTLTCLTPNNENNINCESNSLVSNTIDITNLENQSVLNNNNNNNISNLNSESISNNLSEESLLFLNEKYNQLDSSIKNSNNLANNLLNSRTEQPSHFKYLKEFRVEQCPLFVQHKCTQHKPFTCFNWHFQNQRRRRPLRRKDGTFNYSPDNYCTKYDETTGICVDGDKCTLLHRTAGDTERRYHLRYYKTGICVHDTDIRGFCIKNGAHCAFAHGQADLRNPLYDIHEMTMHISNLDEQENNINMVNGCYSNSLDKDRNALNEDPRWQDTVFVLGNYKTELCKRPPRLCRQGYACPQYHNSKDKRRTPKLYKYRSTPCPSVKQGDEWGDPINCEANDNCNYCHTRTEQQFHPEIYKSTKCNDIQQTGFCPRGPFCAFAHNEQEMNAERELSIESSDLANILSNAFASGGALNLNNANASLDKSTLNASNNSNSSNGGISTLVNRNNFNSNQQLNQFTSSSNISITGQNANSNSNFMPSSVPNHFGFSEFAAANLRSQPLSFRRENSPPILSNQNNNLGPIARPRSYSSSHTSSLHTNLNSNNRQSLLNSYLKNSIDEKVNINGIHNQQGMPTRKVSTPSTLFTGTNTKTDSSTGLFSNNQQFNALQSSLVNTNSNNHIGNNVQNSNTNNFFQNLDTSTTVESVVHSLALDDLNLDDFDASIEKDLANRNLNSSSILEEHRNISANGSVNLMRSSSNLMNSGTTAPVNIPGANHRANLANISSSLANFGQSPISTASINQNISSSVGSSLYDFASHSGVSPTNQQQQLNLIQQQQQQQQQNQAYLINEIHRLRDELVLTKNQGIKFEEELHKAKKACEFWMNEAEKAKLEKEDIERRNNN